MNRERKLWDSAPLGTIAAVPPRGYWRVYRAEIKHPDSYGNLHVETIYHVGRPGPVPDDPYEPQSIELSEENFATREYASAWAAKLNQVEAALGGMA